MHACTGQAAASSQLPCGSAAVLHGSCSMQPQESRLLQLPLEVFQRILEAACSDLSSHGLNSWKLHALYSTCRTACHAIRPLIKHLNVNLDDPATPVKEGLRQLALYPALNRLGLIVCGDLAPISDFMAGTKGTTAGLTAVHKLSVNTCKLDLTSKDISNIVRALPSLRDVTLAAAQLPHNVKPLQRLSGLTQLNLFGEPWKRGKQDVLYRNLGFLTGLQSMMMEVHDTSRLLPHLAQLPKLSHLELFINDAYKASFLVPEFSLLRHLTQLSWKGDDRLNDEEHDMPQQTLDAICACTCLVELNLEVFNITTTAAIKQLVAMPKLKHLAINELPEPSEEPLQPFECSWESLRIGRNKCLRQLLAFSCVPHVRIGRVWWRLPEGGDAASVAAAAAEITAVATVLARGHIKELELEWRELPAVSCSSVIRGLAPVLHQATSLGLRFWVVDKALELQISEALPQLASLTLWAGCTMEQGAWAAMYSLSCLTELTVNCDAVPADVLAFAVATSRSLCMGVGMKSEDDARLLQASRTIIQEQREAQGKPSLTLKAYHIFFS